MFVSFVSVPELLAFYDVSRWGDNNLLATKLNAAAVEVADDLRQAGYDVATVYPPRMFDGLAEYQTVTSSGCTSAAIAGGNERRFVVDYRSGGTSSVFGLEGSNDNAIWQPVRSIDGADASLQCTENGLYSFIFAQSFRYYRYTVTVPTSVPVTFSPYMMDTAADSLVMHKAIVLLLSSSVSSDAPGVLAMYTNSRDAYASIMQWLKINTKDDDGETVETRAHIRLMR